MCLALNSSPITRMKYVCVCVSTTVTAEARREARPELFKPSQGTLNTAGDAE